MYLSQLNEAGQITGIEKRKKVTKGSRSSNMHIGGQAFGFGAKAGFGIGPKVAGEEEEIEKFSSLWINVFYFLNFLHDENLIEDNIEKSAIGSFVLVEGNIEILDLGMVQILYENDAIRKQILEGLNEGSSPKESRQQRRRKSRKRNEDEEVLDLLKNLPHTIQAMLYGKHKVWSNLKDDGLVTSTVDILLKHSLKPEGKWFLLGVLDARPDESFSLEEQIDKMVSAGNPLGDLQASVQLYRAFAPFIRAALGRPVDAYGVTPLLIFREIGREDKRGELAS